jgi:hypothetical protein
MFFSLLAPVEIGAVIKRFTYFSHLRKEYYYRRESCGDNQTSIRLASHLVRAPNLRSGGHEFESPMRELGALTKNGNTLGIRSFYTTSICQRENSQGKYVNIALDDIENLSGLTVYCHAILHMYSITCGRPVLVCNTVIHQFYRDFYLGMFAPAFTRRQNVFVVPIFIYTQFLTSVYTLPWHTYTDTLPSQHFQASIS